MLGSKNFRKVFLLRFFAYFLIQVGFLATVLSIEPVISEEARYQFDQFIGREYVLPTVVTSGNVEVPVASPNLPKSATSGFGALSFGGAEILTPISTDFGVVIEKINANARVVADVDPGNEKSYSEALALGVAHAKGTAYPGQKGNIYLFSHSTDAPWNIVRYNAIFYLLSKLEAGDRIILFYGGRRFDYIVFDKGVVDPNDTKYLTNVYDDSILTLQTCDPPGTLLNRLIVRAKLAST
ncbi:MAG: sortase [Candidatus Daviesbacteria bacterium]|nr:sortase [Candidatus Daviesbacteria bacterium]